MLILKDQTTGLKRAELPNQLITELANSDCGQWSEELGKQVFRVTKAMTLQVDNYKGLIVYLLQGDLIYKFD
jgi:hypothetical protein